MTTVSLLLPQLAAAGLLLLRCSGMFFMVPTLGGEVLPLRLRAALAFLVTLTLAPLAGRFESLEPVRLIVAGIGELVLGTAMGLILRVLLSASDMLGELVGMAMGLSFMQVVDPLTHESQGETARITATLGVLLMLALDGHHTLLAGLGESLREAPVGTVLPRARYALTLFPLCSTAIVTALRVAAPVMAALLIINAGLGLLARAAPQLNIFVLSFAVTVAGGVLILTSSMPSAIGVLAEELRQLPTRLAAVLGG